MCFLKRAVPNNPVTDTEVENIAAVYSLTCSLMGSVHSSCSKIPQHHGMHVCLCIFSATDKTVVPPCLVSCHRRAVFQPFGAIPTSKMLQRKLLIVSYAMQIPLFLLVWGCSGFATFWTAVRCLGQRADQKFLLFCGATPTW